MESNINSASSWKLLPAMAEVETDRSPVDSPTSQSLPFIEVTCKRSGKIRRFAFGTEAGFAVNIINKKSAQDSDPGIPLASYLEAVKEGQIPVIFGPNAPLANYGPGWKLQTVNDADDFVASADANGIKVAGERVQRRAAKVVNDEKSLEKESKPVAISLSYIGKILLAFILIFTLGAVFTLFLENLPLLLLYISNSSV